MTRRTKIRTAHVTAATIAIVASDAFTSYAQTQGHHTASGAWTGWQILGWLLVGLSGLWVAVLGCYGLYRLARLLWGALPGFGPQRRPAPGEGRRKPSPSVHEWARWDAEYAAYRRNARIADTLAKPLGDDDTQLMLLPDIAELDGSLIDAFERHGIAPERVAGASEQAEVLRGWFGTAFERSAA